MAGDQNLKVHEMDVDRMIVVGGLIKRQISVEPS